MGQRLAAGYGIVALLLFWTGTSLAADGEFRPIPHKMAVPAETVAEGGIDCSCRYRGRDIPLGRTICLQMGGRSRLATCRMTLNNTSWDISDTDCAPVARRPFDGGTIALTARTFVRLEPVGQYRPNAPF